jgi:hypothetical protein
MSYKSFHSSKKHSDLILGVQTNFAGPTAFAVRGFATYYLNSLLSMMPLAVGTAPAILPYLIEVSFVTCRHFARQDPCPSSSIIRQLGTYTGTAPTSTLPTPIAAHNTFGIVPPAGTTCTSFTPLHLPRDLFVVPPSTTLTYRLTISLLVRYNALLGAARRPP